MVLGHTYVHPFSQNLWVCSSLLFPMSLMQDGLLPNTPTLSGTDYSLLPEQYDSCVVPWCLYLHTILCKDGRGTFRRLEIAPKDEPDLWRSTVFFLGAWLIYFPNL